MGSVILFNAARMQAIEDSTVTSGIVDANGHLLLNQHNGTSIDAGSVIGPKGRDGFYPIPTSNGIRQYIRLGTIDGIGTSGGGSFEFILSGLGNYGTAKRATVLIHVVQRGSNIITVRSWGWGFEDSNTPLNFFTRQLGEFTFEVWGYFAPYSVSPGLTVLALERAVVNVDSITTVAPSGLVESVINRADSWNTLKDVPNSFEPLAVGTHLPTDPATSYDFGTTTEVTPPLTGWPMDTTIYGTLITTRSYISGPGGTIQYWSAYQATTDMIFYRQWFYQATSWSPWATVNTPAGVILEYGGTVLPPGHVWADGSAISRTIYSRLFSVYGTTYGVGDGSTTFNVPNKKGRTGVGLDSSQTEFNALGKTGGEKAHLLTAAESGLRGHSHQLPLAVTQGVSGAQDMAVRGYGSNDPGFRTGDTAASPAYGSAVVGALPAASAHNNLPPYIALNYIIKT
jgi:microcystin-dependent protein